MRLRFSLYKHLFLCTQFSHVHYRGRKINGIGEFTEYRYSIANKRRIFKIFAKDAHPPQIGNEKSAFIQQSAACAATLADIPSALFSGHVPLPGNPVCSAIYAPPRNLLSR